MELSVAEKGISERCLDKRSGAARPFFLVHVGDAPSLALNTKRESPLLHPLCVEVKSNATSVREIAAELLPKMAKLQPLGPYRVVGWQSCAAVALEVVSQLLARHELVEFCGLVDSGETSWPERPRSRSAANEVSISLNQALLDYELPRVPVLSHLFVTCKDREQAWRHALGGQKLEVHVLEAEFSLTTIEGALVNMQSNSAPIQEEMPKALITIQGGRFGNPPVFCLPGAGASVADFVALSGALGEKYPVHGFQPRGMDGVAPPYVNVESAAEAYLRELDLMHRFGSVCLVGHSFGGWIAFEMALRLQAAGRRVSSLLILDSEPPDKTGENLVYTRAEALMELVRIYEQAVERSLDVRLSDFESRDPEGQLALLHERMVRVGLLPRTSKPRVLLGPVRNFESALHTQYQPRGRFNGSIKLLLVPRVDEEEHAACCRFEAEVAAWRRFAPHLQFRRGTGNHLTLLRPNNVKAWAHCVIDSDARSDTLITSNVPVSPSRRAVFSGGDPRMRAR